MYKIWLIFGFAMLSLAVLAQPRRQKMKDLEEGTFKFYIAAGLNTSQMTNDSLGGFSKWGPIAGIGGFFMFAERFSANMEINYSQRGSRGDVYDVDNNLIRYRYIGTDYVEAPIFVSYHDRNIASFGAGVIIGSLINSSQAINFKNVDNVTQNKYKEVDFSFLLNATFYIKQHWGFNLRYVHSFLPTNVVTPDYPAQYHSVLTMRGMYLF